MVVAILLALSSGKQRATACHLFVLAVTAMIAATTLGWVSSDDYRRLDALEVAFSLAIPALAWRLPGAPARSRATTAALVALGALSVVAVVDAIFATEILIGHMTGIGIDYVLGWFPAMSVYCLRPTLVPLLLVSVVAIAALAAHGRASRAIFRFSIAGGLLLASSYLTRHVHECVARPAVEIALFNTELQTDVVLPPFGRSEPRG